MTASSVVSASTVTSGKAKPAAWMAGPPITAVSATAPPGGCRQRSANIAAIAVLAASAHSSGTGSTSPKQRMQITPISPLTTLPPMADHGCASGLAGSANSSTEDAPIGATRKMEPPGNRYSPIRAVSSRPNRAPPAARNCSRRLAVLGLGSQGASNARMG